MTKYAKELEQRIERGDPLEDTRKWLSIASRRSTPCGSAVPSTLLMPAPPPHAGGCGQGLASFRFRAQERTRYAQPEPFGS
jgi:hypothetical protein